MAGEERELTVLDAYTKRVYKIIMLIIPMSCLCASITVTTLHYLGNFPDVDKIWMWVFNLMDVLFLMIGVYFIRTGFDDDGLVRRDKLLAGKYVVALIAIVQWNAISYIWPFRDFWGFILLFTLGEAFFFDSKLVGFTSAGLIISVFISWFINGEYLLPLKDEYFIANMTFRIICLILTMTCINILTFFGGKFLVEELEKYVYRDPLTQLLTRRTMSGYLQKALEEANSGKQTFSILMIDIDDFKKVNDTHGHDCGDEVLKFVSRIISSVVDKEDRVFRWGGEEMLVLTPGGVEEATSLAEHIRDTVEVNSINYRGEVNVAVTVTIGVTSFENGNSMKEMMDKVDKNLYKGKHNGKNQVVCQ